MLKMHIVAFVLIPFLAPQVAGAEPTDSVQKLMGQPVSHFSFGLYRLAQRLNESYDNRRGLQLEEPLSGKLSYGSSATYDWDRNRIQLKLFRFNAAESWNFEEECRQVIASLRRLALVDATTGLPSAGLPSSTFALQFLPEGYQISGIPQSVGGELDTIMELQFQATSANFRGVFTCTAPLLGTSYSVVRP